MMILFSFSREGRKLEGHRFVRVFQPGKPTEKEWGMAADHQTVVQTQIKMTCPFSMVPCIYLRKWGIAPGIRQVSKSGISLWHGIEKVLQDGTWGLLGSTIHTSSGLTLPAPEHCKLTMPLAGILLHMGIQYFSIQTGTVWNNYTMACCWIR